MDTETAATSTITTDLYLDQVKALGLTVHLGHCIHLHAAFVPLKFEKK